MKRRRGGASRLALAVPCLSAFALGGCPSKPNPIDIEQLATDVSTIMCQQAVSCGRFPDQQTCTKTLMLDYSTLEADKAAGRIAYFEQSAGDCLDDIHHGQGPGSCSLTVVLSSSDLPDCRASIVGQVGKDQPCLADAECDAHFFCDFRACSADATCCTGMCRATVGMMGVCADSTAVCDDGLACIKDPALGMVCQPRFESGQPCSGSTECKGEYVCVVDAKTGGRCNKLPGHGEYCAPPGNPRCDLFTDYCDPDTNKCTSRVARGGGCPKHVECAWFERCDVDNNKCVGRGMIGASCTADDECLDSLSCANAKCAVPTSIACSVP